MIAWKIMIAWKKKTKKNWFWLLDKKKKKKKKGLTYPKINPTKLF